MGNQRLHKVLRVLILSFIFLSLVSCGEFTTKDEDVDTGDVDEVYISLSQEKLQRLYSSVATDSYTTCTLDKGKWHGEADIKVRGLSSRLKPKKSFALKIDGRKYMLERGQENGGLYNRIAMRTYQLAGVTACDTESVALFLNDEYLGCYNFITYYDPDFMEGELYKCWFSYTTDMGRNHPLISQTEKKFPKDGDMSNMEHLIYACSSLSAAEWREFVLEKVDIDKTASYLVVHDFLTVIDTNRTNYYIQFDGKYRIIPWDNEQSFLAGQDREKYTLCGGNQLVRQLTTVPEFKTAYNQKMQELFTGGGATCILDQLKEEAGAMFDDLCTAMKSDPAYATSREDFIKIKSYVLKYLDKDTGRAADGDRLVLH